MGERISELTAASQDGRLCYRGSGKHGGWQREAEILPEISLRENTLFHTVTRVNFCSSSLTGGIVGRSEEHTKRVDNWKVEIALVPLMWNTCTNQNINRSYFNQKK